MAEKRFTVIYNEQSIMMQYVDNCKEEPNAWAVWNTRETAQKLNELSEENKQLKKELSEYKDFVLSDDKILCYTCLFCTHKGIYEVDCDVKGHVDVHGTCHSYTKKELQE